MDSHSDKELGLDHLFGRHLRPTKSSRTNYSQDIVSPSNVEGILRNNESLWQQIELLASSITIRTNAWKQQIQNQSTQSEASSSFSDEFDKSIIIGSRKAPLSQSAVLRSISPPPYSRIRLRQSPRKPLGFRITEDIRTYLSEFGNVHRREDREMILKDLALVEKSLASTQDSTQDDSLESHRWQMSPRNHQQNTTTNNTQQNNNTQQLNSSTGSFIPKLRGLRRTPEGNIRIGHHPPSTSLPPSSSPRSVPLAYRVLSLPPKPYMSKLEIAKKDGTQTAANKTWTHINATKPKPLKEPPAIRVEKRLKVIWRCEGLSKEEEDEEEDVRKHFDACMDLYKSLGEDGETAGRGPRTIQRLRTELERIGSEIKLEQEIRRVSVSFAKKSSESPQNSSEEISLVQFLNEDELWIERVTTLWEDNLTQLHNSVDGPKHSSLLKKKSRSNNNIKDNPNKPDSLMGEFRRRFNFQRKLREVRKYKAFLFKLRSNIDSELRSLKRQEKRFKRDCTENYPKYSSWHNTALMNSFREHTITKVGHIEAREELLQEKQKLVNEKIRSVQDFIQQCRLDSSVPPFDAQRDLQSVFTDPLVIRLSRQERRLEKISKAAQKTFIEARGEAMIDDRSIKLREMLQSTVLDSALKYHPYDDGAQSRMSYLLLDLRYGPGKKIQKLIETLESSKQVIPPKEILNFLEGFSFNVAVEYNTDTDEESLSKLMLYMNRVIFPKIYPVCIRSFAEDPQILEKNEIFRSRAQTLRAFPPAKIDPSLTQFFMGDTRPFQKSIDCLEYLHFELVPTDMLMIVRNVVKILCQEAEELTEEPLTSDNIIPVLIYVCVHADMEPFCQLLAYMEAFSSRFEETNELGFCLVSLQAAVEAICSGFNTEIERRNTVSRSTLTSASHLRLNTRLKTRFSIIYKEDPSSADGQAGVSMSLATYPSSPF
eukprot:TRINITY_DN10233_c0_g1_i1.p1 TRINITY_DN10233_c0_g1~~TRINITY_DN10233_c0_g1_i1.p1  ORF type:complete len:937 (-),score=163.57 TRINITY_DN10233_c0_g1_i1:147-2957(-)